MNKINWNSDDLTEVEIVDVFLDGVTESDDYAILKKFLVDAVLENDPINDVYIFHLMRLDYLDIRGEKLVKLWNLCYKDMDYFKRTIGYIVGRVIVSCFSEEEVRANLDLENPLPFISKNFNYTFSELCALRPKFGNEAFDEFICEIRKNFVREYNKKATFYDLGKKLLDMPEFKRVDLPSLPNEKTVDIRNLYFGGHDINLTGDGLGINMQTYALYEKGINSLVVYGEKLYPLMEIPTGEFVLIDENGEKIEVNHEVEIEGVSILPTKKITNLYVCSVGRMVEDAKNRGLRSKFIDEYDLRCFYDRWDITVSDCRSYINELTDLYQTVYGPLDVKRRK